MKDSVLEPSYPICHSKELVTIIEQRAPEKPVLFIYSNGSPDYHVIYFSVKLALIAFFLKRNLDYLCATHTAPYHLYRNPKERIVSIVNL